MNIPEAKDVVLSIGNQQFTGKDCLVESFEIESKLGEVEEVNFFNGEVIPIQRAPDPVRITIELVCQYDKFFAEFFDKDYKPRIRNKKVEDCSIKELLFAVREKMRGK